MNMMLIIQYVQYPCGFLYFPDTVDISPGPLSQGHPKNQVKEGRSWSLVHLRGDTKVTVSENVFKRGLVFHQNGLVSVVFYQSGL